MSFLPKSSDAKSAVRPFCINTKTHTFHHRQSKISSIIKLLKSWSAMTVQWALLIKPDKVVLHWQTPIRGTAVDLSQCYLRKRYITWGPDSPGHAWMYGADSRAGCHPSGLINEEPGPVFNVFNMGRWRGRHTDGTHPSLWLMKSPAALSPLSLSSSLSHILTDTHTFKRTHPFCPCKCITLPCWLRHAKNVWGAQNVYAFVISLTISKALADSKRSSSLKHRLMYCKHTLNA